MSLLGSIDLAQTRTGDALFKKFELGKWFALGFPAWPAVFVVLATHRMIVPGVVETRFRIHRAINCISASVPECDVSALLSPIPPPAA